MGIAQYDANGDPLTEDVDDGQGGTITQQVMAQNIYRAMPAATLLDFLADVIVDDSDPENPVYGRPTEAAVPSGWSYSLPVAIA